jgi:hypothetical protein
MNENNENFNFWTLVPSFWTFEELGRINGCKLQNKLILNIYIYIFIQYLFLYKIVYFFNKYLI